MSGAGPQRELRLGGRVFGPEQLLVMAIVNRTPDSFYRPGVTWDPAAAMERVHAVVAEGADIVDVGGVPARPGDEVDVREEIRRTVPFITAIRDAYPELVISVDTWRHEPARAARRASPSTRSSTSAITSGYSTRNGRVRGGRPPACEQTRPASNSAAISARAGSQPPQVSFSRSAPASQAA